MAWPEDALSNDEQIVSSFRPHWKLLFIPFVWFLGLSIAMIFVAVAFDWLQWVVLLVLAGLLVGDRLGFDAGHVVVEGHGSRAEVGTNFRVAPGSFPPQIGELADVVIHGRLIDIAQHLFLLEVHDRIFHDFEGHADLI